MDKWIRHSDFYEPIYLHFLEDVVHGVYTTIARSYSIAFWEEFTVEFNRRIEVVLADPLVVFAADSLVGFENFSVDEVVTAGVRLRQKSMDYKGRGPRGGIPNFNLLKRCFEKCNCPYLPRFPTALNIYASPTSRHSNITGDGSNCSGSSCGGPSRRRSTSKNSLTTPQGRNAMKALSKLFTNEKVTQAEYDRAMEYFDICVTKCVGFLNVPERARERFIKEIPGKVSP